MGKKKSYCSPKRCPIRNCDEWIGDRMVICNAHYDLLSGHDRKRLHESLSLYRRNLIGVRAHFALRQEIIDIINQKEKTKCEDIQSLSANAPGAVTGEKSVSAREPKEPSYWWQSQ